MGIFEDLNTGKYNLILFVIIFLLIFHQYFNNGTKEHMADVSSTQIADAVKKYYLADVEAIRNLSNIATQLQASGLTVPGDLKTSGELYVKNWLRVHGDQGIYFQDRGGGWHMNDNDWIKSYGNKHVYCNKEIKGNIMSSEGHMNVGTELYVNNWVRVRGDNGIIFDNRGGGWHMKDNDWIRSYGGKNVYCDKEIRGNTMFTETDMTVSRNLNVGGELKIGNTIINENTIKRLLAQQSIAGWAVDGAQGRTLLYEGEYNLWDTSSRFDRWTNDNWDNIYVNRGWRIRVWDDYVNGAVQIVDATNKNDFIPTKHDLTVANKASGYKAEWVGY